MKQLKNVNLAGEGKFIVNQHVIVYDIDMNSDGVVYSFDWDQKYINEKEASEIAARFIKDSIVGIIKIKCK
jgi:hypothetical protein